MSICDRWTSYDRLILAHGSPMARSKDHCCSNGCRVASKRMHRGAGAVKRFVAPVKLRAAREHACASASSAIVLTQRLIVVGQRWGARVLEAGVVRSTRGVDGSGAELAALARASGAGALRALVSALRAGDRCGGPVLDGLGPRVSALGLGEEALLLVHHTLGLSRRPPLLFRRAPTVDAHSLRSCQARRCAPPPGRRSRACLLRGVKRDRVTETVLMAGAVGLEGRRRAGVGG